MRIVRKLGFDLMMFILFTWRGFCNCIFDYSCDEESNRQSYEWDYPQRKVEDHLCMRLIIVGDSLGIMKGKEGFNGMFHPRLIRECITVSSRVENASVYRIDIDDDHDF